MSSLYPAKFISKYPITSFFAMTMLLIWASMAANVAGLYPSFGQWPVHFEGHLVAVLRTRRTLINWAPNLVAAMVLYVTGGWRAVGKLFAKFLKWRVGAKAWVIAVLLPVAVASMAAMAYGLSGRRVDLTYIKLVPALLAIRFLFALTAESVGGEAGWRGFALDRLQRKNSPLAASLIVGIIWALAHLPIVTVRGFDAFELIVFMVAVMSLSVILTWFYNWTGGSLLVVAVVHGLFDAVDAVYSRNFTALVSRVGFLTAMTAVLLGLSIILIVVTRGDLGKIVSSENPS